jgi:hypothetical protein
VLSLRSDDRPYCQRFMRAISAISLTIISSRMPTQRLSVSMSFGSALLGVVTLSF